MNKPDNNPRIYKMGFTAKQIRSLAAMVDYAYRRGNSDGIGPIPEWDHREGIALQGRLRSFATAVVHSEVFLNIIDQEEAGGPPRSS